MKYILGLTLTLFIVGCKGGGSNSADTEAWSWLAERAFYREWVHSYEEQNRQSNSDIFRLKGSREFEPSLFRLELAFDYNGQCRYLYLAPNDAHEMRDCVYTKIGNVVSLFDNDGAHLSHLDFAIHSVSPDELRIARGVRFLRGWARRKSYY